jgi:hypothetical protein
MDWKIAQKPGNFCENWRNWSEPVSLVFHKPAGQIWFFFKILKIFEIKILKETRVHFKIFGQNRIQKFEIARPTKLDEVKIIWKIRKPLSFSQKPLDFSQKTASKMKSRICVCCSCSLIHALTFFYANRRPRAFITGNRRPRAINFFTGTSRPLIMGNTRPHVCFSNFR